MNKCICGHSEIYHYNTFMFLKDTRCSECNCKVFTLQEEKEEPKVIILDDNPLSIGSYAEEFPENWKKITEDEK